MARLVPLMAVLLALAPDAIAQSKAIGRYNDWRVYTEGEGRNMVCFAAVEASDMAPKAADHGEVTFYVAAFKSGAATSQPSLRVGYTLRKDLAPAAIIGRDRFPMYAAGAGGSREAADRSAEERSGTACGGIIREGRAHRVSFLAQGVARCDRQGEGALQVGLSRRRLSWRV